MNTEPVSFRMEIDVAPFKMITMVQEHNEEIRQRIEEGCKQAVEFLKGEGVIEAMVKEQVIKSIREAISSYGWAYEVQSQAKKTIQEALAKTIKDYSDKIVEAVLESAKKTEF